MIKFFFFPYENKRDTALRRVSCDPVGIKYPKSLPLAVLQTKKESELISKLLIRTLFAL